MDVFYGISLYISKNRLDFVGEIDVVCDVRTQKHMHMEWH